MPQVVDRLGLHGARRRHRQAFELVLALGRAAAQGHETDKTARVRVPHYERPGVDPRYAGMPAGESADPRRRPLSSPRTSILLKARHYYWRPTSDGVVGVASGKVVQVVTYLDAASSEPLHPAAREVLLAALGPGVRRSATPAPRGPLGAAAAGQRAGGRGRAAWACAPTRSASCPAAPTPCTRGCWGCSPAPRGAATSWPTQPSSTPRCCTPAAGTRRAAAG